MSEKQLRGYGRKKPISNVIATDSARDIKAPRDCLHPHLTDNFIRINRYAPRSSGALPLLLGPRPHISCTSSSAMQRLHTFGQIFKMWHAF